MIFSVQDNHIIKKLKLFLLKQAGHSIKFVDLINSPESILLYRNRVGKDQH